MTGETNLSILLRAMQPGLHADEFIFVTIAPEEFQPPNPHPLMRFEEAEGTTLILRRAEAERAGLAATFPCRMITLDVHSSLEAVGFLTAITTRLSAAGIGVNPVSAFFHDHLFIATERADEAFALLQGLRARPAAPGRNAPARSS